MSNKIIKYVLTRITICFPLTVDASCGYLCENFEYMFSTQVMPLEQVSGESGNDRRVHSIEFRPQDPGIYLIVSNHGLYQILGNINSQYITKSWMCKYPGLYACK